MSWDVSIIRHSSGIFKTGTYIGTFSEDGFYMDTVFDKKTEQWYQAVSPDLESMYEFLDEVDASSSESNLFAAYYRAYNSNRKKLASMALINMSTGSISMFHNHANSNGGKKTFKPPSVYDFEYGDVMIHGKFFKPEDTAEFVGKLYHDEDAGVLRLEHLPNGGYLKYTDLTLPTIESKPKANLRLVSN